MRKIIATGGFVILAPVLAACTSHDYVPEGTLSAHAGEAVQRNIAAQLANPAAPSGDEALTMNGERAAIAQDRYSKDQVKQPPQAMAGSVGGGGAGGGGGGTSVGAGAAAVP